MTNNSQGAELSDVVADFLDKFDGSATQAIMAIRQYGSQQKSRKLTRPAPAGPVLVSVQQATKSYKVGKQRVNALNGASLDIYQGEFIALTGPSGSGKSTLLQLIGGLDRPTAGAVIVDNIALNRLGDTKLSQFRGQTVGFVFQFFYLQPFLKLARNLEVPAMFAGIPRQERASRIRELAEQVGLTDRLDHYPKELSGGQMQRAAIARALLNRPKILLADEPTGNLDTANSRAIIDLFEKIRQELGTTIVLVTHDPAVASRADREVKIRDGKVVS